MHTLLILLLLALTCTALGQDQEIEIVVVPKEQMAILLKRLARQDAKIEKLERQIYDNKVMLGCT